MIDPEIQRFVQDAIDQAQSKARYNTTNAVYHLHNGIDAPELPKLAYIKLGVGTSAVLGTTGQLIVAQKGTLYINIGTSVTATTRLFINVDGGTTWASFTASA